MELTPEAMESITAGIKAGDTACLKIWADRCDPVSKATLPTVEFMADTTDLTRFSMSVLAAISKGEVTLILALKSLMPPPVLPVSLRLTRCAVNWQNYSSRFRR